jgi:hypothetical protein
MTAFALAVIDAQIADSRASGDTGNVENLIEARAAFAELFEASGRITGTVQGEALLVDFGSLADLVTALIRVQGDA